MKLQRGHADFGAIAYVMAAAAGAAGGVLITAGVFLLRTAWRLVFP